MSHLQHQLELKQWVYCCSSSRDYCCFSFLNKSNLFSILWFISCNIFTHDYPTMWISQQALWMTLWLSPISLQTVISLSCIESFFSPLRVCRMLYPWQQHLLPVASEIMYELDCWFEAQLQHKALTINSDTLAISWLRGQNGLNTLNLPFLFRGRARTHTQILCSSIWNTKIILYLISSVYVLFFLICCSLKSFSFLNLVCPLELLHHLFHPLPPYLQHLLLSLPNLCGVSDSQHHWRSKVCSPGWPWSLWSCTWSHSWVDWHRPPAVRQKGQKRQQRNQHVLLP